MSDHQHVCPNCNRAFPCTISHRVAANALIGLATLQTRVAQLCPNRQQHRMEAN